MAGFSKALPLPHELVVKVLSNLYFASDKKNARSVCRDFAAAGLTSLSRGVIHFSAFRCDLDRLLEISRHPKLSRLVRTLYCHTPMLAEGYEVNPARYLAWWARERMDGVDDPLLDKEDRHGEVLRRYRSFLRLHVQQLSFNEEEQLELVAAFKRMPAIKTVIMTDDHCASDRRMPTKTTNWQRAFHLADQANNIWDPTRSYHAVFVFVLRAIRASMLMIESFSAVQRAGDDFTLKTAQEPQSYGLDHQLLARASATEGEALRYLVMRCKSVSLLINNPEDQLRHNNSIALESWEAALYGDYGLSRMLRGVDALEELTLGTANGYNNSPVPLNVCRLLGQPKALTSHLKVFRLFHFVIEQAAHLAVFLECHAPTLQEVGLCYIRLADSTWTDFIADLQHRRIEGIPDFKVIPLLTTEDDEKCTIPSKQLEQLFARLGEDADIPGMFEPGETRDQCAARGVKWRPTEAIDDYLHIDMRIPSTMREDMMINAELATIHLPRARDMEVMYSPDGNSWMFCADPMDPIEFS